MAGNRRSGSRGALYLAQAAGGSAQPYFYLTGWTIDFTVDQEDVTAMGDTNRVYVVGLPNGSGSFEGFWSDDGIDTFTAATDGVKRKFYLYPDATNNAAYYYFGEAFADFSSAGDVSSGVKASGKLTASGNWSRHVG